MPGGLKSPVTPIWRGCRPRTFASGVLSPLGPWIAAAGRRQRTPPFRPPGPSPADPRSAAGRDAGRCSGLRSACAAVRLAPRPTPVRRRACSSPQAAPPPIAPRRDAARSPEPTARRPMRCRRSARVSRVLGRRAPGAAPEGRPRATCARVCGTAASLHRHHAARHGCRGGGLGGARANIRRSDQPRTAHAGSSKCARPFAFPAPSSSPSLPPSPSPSSSLLLLLLVIIVPPAFPCIL